MAKFETRSHPLGDLYDELEGLRKYGDNAVVRRLLTTVYERLRSEVAERETACRPDINGHCRPDRCLTFSVHDGIEETRADDRRRSVFLDPDESFLANYLDFLEGRLEVLEFRDPGLRRNFDELEQQAKAELRHRLPLVVVNHFVAGGPEQIVSALRSLADEIEAGRATNHASRIKGGAIVSSVMRAEHCRHLRTEARGGRYTNNGRTHETLHVEVLECKANDGCCGNQAYTKDGNSRWVVDWTDGNHSSRPPEPPPGHVNQPWTNQIPILDNATGAQLSSDYGWRTNNGATEFHGGIDVAAPVGTGVNSNVSGRVVVALNGAWDRSGVVVQVGNRTHTYWHITPGVAEGAQITAGQPLGTIKAGGPPHVHYAIHEPPGGDHSQRNDGNSINPLP